MDGSTEAGSGGETARSPRAPHGAETAHGAEIARSAGTARGAGPTGRPDAHTWLFGLLALLLLLIAGRGWDKALSERGNDLTIYLDSAQVALEGGNPLLVPDSIYLPFFDCLLAPLALLPRAVFAGLWQVASWACIVWGLVQFVRLADPERRRPWLLWVTTLLTLRLWDSNLSYGQANAFTFACLIASLRALAADRERIAGAWIGFAAAFKVLPGLALLLLVARRSVRGTLTGLGVLIGLSLLVPPLFLGLRGSLEAHRTWVEEVSGPYLLGGDDLLEKRPYVAGQSLLAAAYRTLGNTPVTRSDLERRASVAELEPDTVHAIARTLIALHLGAVGVVLWRRRRERGRAVVAETGALLMCTALVCGPLIHKAHMSWSAVGFAVLALSLADARGVGRLRAGVPLVLATALIGLSTPLFFGTERVRDLVAVNGLTLGLEFLWIGVLSVAWRRRVGLSEPVGAIPGDGPGRAI